MACRYSPGALPRRTGPGDPRRAAPGLSTGRWSGCPLEQWCQQFVTDAEFDPTLCIVASNASGIVGVAQCWTSAYIKNLVIHPNAQGQGLGRALLQQVFQVFQQRREGFVDLKVLETNVRARRLYESAGMVFVLRDLVPEE